MPYQSKLAAVLVLRKRNEDDASYAFLTAKNLLVLQQGQLLLLDNKLQVTMDDLTLKQSAGATSEELTRYFRFLGMFQGKIAAQAKAIKDQEVVCEGRRALLEIAVRERKAVEIIEEKRKKAYLKEITKKEQAILDEIGGQLKSRRHA